MADKPEERRRDDQVLRQAIVAHIQDEDSKLDELRRDHKEIAHDLRCLKESVEKYQPFLDRLMKEDGNWQKVKTAVIERSASGLVWAVVLLIGLSIWEFIVKRIIRTVDF